jgi:hypothetical protein
LLSYLLDTERSAIMVAPASLLMDDMRMAKILLRPARIVLRYRQIIALMSRTEVPRGVSLQTMLETVVAFDAMEMEHDATRD